MDYVLATRLSVRSFLDTIDAPILAVDGQVRAIATNRPSLLFLGKEHSDIEDKLGGEIIECENAYAPGGCGKTVHCTGCQIRGSVNHTWSTGKPCLHVRAQQHIKTPAGVRTYDFLISTEKLGDRAVLLRIDEAREAVHAA
jgi:hypothetical protein